MKDVFNWSFNIGHSYNQETKTIAISVRLYMYT